VPIVDGLAKSYAGRPVVFIQYELDSEVSRVRHERFMAGWQLDKQAAELSPATPHTMVDSGRRVSYGERDYKADFRKMVDDELPRPAGAIIDAVRDRPDTRTLRVRAQITNVSALDLQAASNNATVHVVVYEGSRTLHYGTKVHLAQSILVDEALEPGQTRLFEFTFDIPRGVNGSTLEAVVMLDFQPPGGEGRWDMLQAAIAHTGDFLATPTPWPSPIPPPTRTAVPTLEPTAEPTVAPSPAPTEPAPPCYLYLPRTLRRWM
jgi:hypothetical protein